MTGEEAKKEIIDMANGLQLIQNTPKGKAVSMALKALEQEPCEDAISKQAGIEGLTELINNLKGVQGDMGSAVNSARELIKSLPPVTPQPKTGYWIDDKCSECGKGIDDLIDSCEWYKLEEPKFCPFCGVKIVKSEG